MAHPALGLPPPDVSAGLPAAAARLRVNNARLSRLALANTVRLEASFAERYDEAALRLFLRDFERHVEQLARALETGRESFVTNYGEWLVPVYRRRRVPMADFISLLGGLRQAVATVLSPEENAVTGKVFERWAQRLKHHGRLPGDHRGNPIIRFFWKGAGIGDDKWV
ncbi:MAG: hypothetical protein M3253_07970, partial [Chloroflexota bacterium]|nr:hypothetical protein [Chloroflexota bacterium]